MAPQGGCPPPSSETNIPILPISILGILATAILLLSYYVFVVKCCITGHHHRHDIIRWLSLSQRRRQWSNRGSDGLSFSAIYSSRGLDESTIQAIPTLRYKRREEQKSSFNECAVCLNEFQDEERIRLLPSCLHVFHIDCIDTWLQTHANCPLCRAVITTPVLPLDSIAIDVGDEGSDHAEAIAVSTTNPSVRRKESRMNKVMSMGDECIDVRRKRDEQFDVQPIRRSLSMDSSSDQKLYMAVQEILRQNPRFWEVRNGEGSSNGGSVRTRRTSFFAFGGHCRKPKCAVLPLQIQQ